MTNRIDNSYVALLERVNNLAARHGLAPWDFVATVGEDTLSNGNGANYTIQFEAVIPDPQLRPADQVNTNMKYYNMLAALGLIDQEEKHLKKSHGVHTLRGDARAIGEKLEQSIINAPAVKRWSNSY